MNSTSLDLNHVSDVKSLPIRPKPSTSEPSRTAGANVVAENELAFLKRPRNEWSTEQKTALCILVRLHGSDNWVHVRNLFQTAYYLDLLRRGFFRKDLASSGLTSQALRTQFDTLMRQNAPEYVHVCINKKFEDLKWDFPVIYYRLVKAAIEVDRGAAPLDFESAAIEDLSEAYERAESPSLSSTYSTGQGDRVTAEEEIGHQFRPKVPAEHRPNFNVSIPKHDGLPFIGFRVYSSYSAGRNSTEDGFTAAAFCGNDAATFEPTPRPHEPRLVRYAANHLNRELVLSPFISISDSLIWSLSRCAVEARKGIATRVAIINVFAIDVPIFGAATLCTAVKQAGMCNWKYYRGSCEYLVWKKIAPGPAIIADVSYSEICQICQRNPDVGRMLQLETIKSRNSVFSIRNSLNATKTEDWRLATTLGRLIKFFKPNVYINDPFVINFARVIMQNWLIGSEELLKDRHFLATLQISVHGPVRASGEYQEGSSSEARTIKGVFITPKRSRAFAGLEASSSFGLPTPPDSGATTPYESTMEMSDCASPCAKRRKRLHADEAQVS